MRFESLHVSVSVCRIRGRIRTHRIAPMRLHYNHFLPHALSACRIQQRKQHSKCANIFPTIIFNQNVSPVTLFTRNISAIFDNNFKFGHSVSQKYRYCFNRIRDVCCIRWYMYLSMVDPLYCHCSCRRKTELSQISFFIIIALTNMTKPKRIKKNWAKVSLVVQSS